ncbi:MAG: hypothetical protein ACI915_000016 [Gammaproteobacteria bacterium]|jgi:hypothetical protein
MNTGIESWNVNLMEIGPMYPFVGSEMWLTVIGVVLWLLWHVVQARAETEEIAKEAAKYLRPEALTKAMDDSPI